MNKIKEKSVKIKESFKRLTKFTRKTFNKNFNKFQKTEIKHTTF